MAHRQMDRVSVCNISHAISHAFRLHIHMLYYRLRKLRVSLTENKKKQSHFKVMKSLVVQPLLYLPGIQLLIYCYALFLLSKKLRCVTGLFCQYSETNLQPQPQPLAFKNRNLHLIYSKKLTPVHKSCVTCMTEFFAFYLASM